MSAPRKSLSKREQEELRKKQDQEAAAQVYEEFVATFNDTGKHSKAWVKGGTFNPDKSATESRYERGRLYKPTSKLAELASTFQSVKELKKDKDDGNDIQFNKKRKDEKKKSNLEMFKEELKRIQEEREERHKIKRMMKDPSGMQDERLTRFDPVDNIPVSLKGTYDPLKGNFDLSTDENTTNIYVGNINPKMTEQQLCETFGRHGPLASIKIMWPRTDEERSRGRNCGFVAFMNRKDAERGMNALKGKEICGFEMKLGWGKAVPIPPHPVYIPPALMEMTLPPPPSGLPFNAQPQRRREKDRHGKLQPLNVNSMPKEELDKTLSKAVVKVVIPTERNLLSVIHRMVEFVVREGPMFEAMIMNRELNNPLFKFLFENQSPAHIYYRWKLFSILNGDTPYRWRSDQFRMFKHGSYWKPPPMNPYTQGMPDELVDNGGVKELPVDEQEIPAQTQKKGQLTDSQRDRLEDMLRELTPERQKIGEAMVWCMDHAESAEEVVECIAESLSILQTPIAKKVARLFLVSDVLYNSSAKVPNASFFRKHLQAKMPDIFRDVHETYETIDGRLKAEQFKQKVMLCFRAWEDWAVYPNDYLIKLQNVFLGLVPTVKVPEPEPKDEDLDGAPLPDPDLDGLPFMGRELPVSAPSHRDDDPDLDGLPLGEELDVEPKVKEEELDGKQIDEPAPQSKFSRSKWETVDETELEAQAMTTSKWDLLGEEEQKGEEEEDLDGQPIEEENLDGREMVSEEEGYIDDSSSYGHDSHRKQHMSEERRAKLREIEVKVMKYQDELEVGRRSRKPNMSLSQQVEHHRKKLLSKEFNDSPVRDSRKRHRSGSPISSRYDDSPKRSKRNKSPKRSRRSRSRSPHKRSSSRSPSRHRRKSKKKHRD